VSDGTAFGTKMHLLTNNTSNVETRGITIDAAQNVGIGTDSPDYKLHVAGSLAAGATVITSADASNAFIIKTNHSGNPTALQIGGSGAINGVSSANQSFTILNVAKDSGSGNSAYFHGHVKTAGNFVVAAGQGVLFGGTAGASGMVSQVLDDYEEGTFDLGVQAAGTLGSSSKGKYTKIGNQVTVFCQVDTGSDYSNSNILHITGLPFTSVSPHTTGHAGNGAVSYTANMGGNVISAVAESGTTKVFFSLLNSGTLTHAACSGVWAVRFTITYNVA
jgi:hypothetical protein